MPTDKHRFVATLARAASASASSLRRWLEADLSGRGVALVDVTDALVSFEIHGPATRDVLSKGCGLDFHPRSFLPGQCARTRFAQIPVLIECIDESSRFELSVAQSYSAYLHSWLKDAAE